MPVNGSRVRQAREIEALTQQQMAERLGISQPDLSLIEQAAKKPRTACSQALSLVTGFPARFFHRPDGPDFPLGSTPIQEEPQAPQRQPAAQLRQSARLALELLQELGRPFSSPSRSEYHWSAAATQPRRPK